MEGSNTGLADDTTAKQMLWVSVGTNCTVSVFGAQSSNLQTVFQAAIFASLTELTHIDTHKLPLFSSSWHNLFKEIEVLPKEWNEERCWSESVKPNLADGQDPRVVVMLFCSHCDRQLFVVLNWGTTKESCLFL